MSASSARLNSDQAAALELLNGHENVFLTGGAGTGKSFLIRHFLETSRKPYPILASTGAAAILLGGRTFHSFFGLGILEGGIEATVEKALKNKRVVERIRGAAGVVIDEISMIPGQALRAAEQITRIARKKSISWGGLRIIVVGDFAQLPPVTPFSQGARDWGFLDQTWGRSQFAPAVLGAVMRTSDSKFLEVLHEIRVGKVTEAVASFLNSRVVKPGSEAHGAFRGTRMYPHRGTTEEHNLRELSQLSGKMSSFQTLYSGKAQAIESLKKNAPIPDVIHLKESAFVMLRQNDPAGHWVNGSLGHITEIDSESLTIKLVDGGEVEIEPVTFHLLDANGERAASAANFPVSLAYATTIHKAQGTTLDRMMVDLQNLWEPGHAYVALSRVRTPEGLFIERWNPRSILVDRAVIEFHGEIGM